MTRRALESVIGKAALDEGFRHALFSDPDATLSEFTLTRAEIQALKAIDSEALEYFANCPGLSMAQSILALHRENGDAGVD